MIGKSIKDFLKCLKYYFVPFGILSIFVIIGFSGMVNGIVSAVKTFITDAGNIANNVSIDWGNMWNTFLGDIMQVDFNQNLDAIVKTFTSSEWIGNTLQHVASVMFGDTLTMDQITELVTTAVTGIVMSIITFLLMILLGFVLGIFVMKLLLRKELTKVKTGKLLLYSLLDTLFWIAVIVILMLLGSVIKWLVIVLVVLLVVLLPLLCLCEGYVFYARKKVPFKELVNIKDVLLIYLIGLIDLTITVLITGLILLIFKGFLGIYLIIPIIEIGILGIGLVAENFVVNKVKDKTEKEIQKEVLTA